MPKSNTETPVRVQRVFGFFVFVAGLGLTYSLLDPRLSGDRRPAGLTADPAAEAALAYAACQSGVRARSLRGAHFRFPATAESFGRADGNQWAVVSQVIVSPVSGSPFAQRFACRVSRFGAGPASVWRVSRLSLELPET